MQTRTEAMNLAYKKFREENPNQPCIFCNKDRALKEFDYWVLMDVKFPYDNIATDQVMLAPKRHVSEWKEVNQEERDEYFFIRALLLDKYDCAWENSTKEKTIPGHLHEHYLIFKK